ncbi:MAG: hypothetical protein ACHP7E_12005 [Burkholderiales bacterium]
MLPNGDVAVAEAMQVLRALQTVFDRAMVATMQRAATSASGRTGSRCRATLAAMVSQGRATRRWANEVYRFAANWLVAAARPRRLQILRKLVGGTTSCLGRGPC